MDADPVLEIDDLSKRFGRKLVIDHLSLTVRRGDIFGFLGPNGAGKTTTIRIALGLIRPTSGEVRIFGEEARRSCAARARVGAVVEIPRFYPYLSGRENLRLLARLSGLDDDAALNDALGVVELMDVADEPVNTYSQGMRQRLGLAQALLGEPDLIVLDEPTNGLDPKGVRDVRKLIARVNKERDLTFFISSHLLHEVEMLCTHVAIIDRGKLVEQGRVSELLRPEADYFRLIVSDAERARAVLEKAGFFLLPPDEANEGDDSIDVIRLNEPETRVPDANALLVERGIRVRTIEPVKPSLEEHFLRRTGGAS